jgi:hypothetical protein
VVVGGKPENPIGHGMCRLANGSKVREMGSFCPPSLQSGVIQFK